MATVEASAPATLGLEWAAGPVGRPEPAAAATAGATSRVGTDGPWFTVDGQRSFVRGVTYGTFACDLPDHLPRRAQVQRDFACIAAAGFTTVRTYVEPRPEVLDLAHAHALTVLVGLWWQDALHHAAPTPSSLRAAAAHGRAVVRAAARRCAGHPAVLGLLVGNEIPADVVRCHGRRAVERLLADLAAAGHDGDPERLLGYADYPTTGFLDTSPFDFDCVNVFLEDRAAFERYVLALRRRAGERPLLLGELGLDAGRHGEQRQARTLDEQLATALGVGVAGACVFSFTDDWGVAGRPVEGWSFGLTRADRSPRPALAAAGRRLVAGTRGLRRSWPAASVVVCAYQAERTLDASLSSLAHLDYPDVEVVVVDDGSTDATAEVAARHPVRLVRAAHLGLSAARNRGAAEARGAVVAYLDADARADRDWLTHLVLALERPGAVAAGGPNVPPPDDPVRARAVGLAPGGPVPVLLDDGWAEHVPGCTMAFRADALRAVGGFDTRFVTAGDDADVCWRLLDAGGRIAYAPAALVWHSPRGSARAFWRQQVGYGRAEALLAAKHPDRFTGSGHARWAGTVYPAPPLRLPPRQYAGTYGDAPYARLYGGASVATRQALLAIGAAALAAPVVPGAGALAATGAGALGAAVLSAAVPAVRRAGLPAREAVVVAALHLVQPIAREAGRLAQVSAGRGQPRPALPPSTWDGGRVLSFPAVPAEERVALLRRARASLVGAGLRAEPAAPDDPADLRWWAGPAWCADARACTTTAGTHLRLRLRPQPGAWAFGAVVLGARWSRGGAGSAARAAAGLAAAALADLVTLRRRTGRALRPASAGSAGSAP